MNTICWVALALLVVLAVECVWIYVLYRNEKKKSCEYQKSNVVLRQYVNALKDENFKRSAAHCNALIDLYAAKFEKWELQKKLSSVFCPRNDHFWVDVNGVKQCRKCGMKAESFMYGEV